MLSLRGPMTPLRPSIGLHRRAHAKFTNDVALSAIILKMKIVKDKIGLEELKEMAANSFGDIVKAVVDVEREIMAVDGELHSDEEAMVLESGSKQENLWGINFYPELSGEDFIEFDSMINLRPSAGNRSRSVDNPKIREQIKAIIDKLVRK